ncbi:putative F-box protein At1g50870 [Aegilops tauschii subsp. strangulata]|uniref:putative F-box protein At1g50870 n=1 Tax=Aegilops tauschii subsp. strangulata TaxID=200361 RepID=UPI003CC8BD3A
METANKRSKASAAELGAVLPPDVVWEILLRVPAWSLWRFRGVCRSWRSLLSDSSFVKAHAALRPGFILALARAEDRIDVVDLSGHVVKQINIPAAEEEWRTHVLDPDTGAVAALPFDDLELPSRKRITWYAPEPCYALWLDLSTGQHKVLRVATLFRHGRLEQQCDVLTLGDDQRCWRRRPSPPICITSNLGAEGVIIQGFVYFMADETFSDFIMDISRYTRDDDRRAMDLMNTVASFNLQTEKWSSSTLRGPSAIDNGTGNCRLKLAKLSNTLVMMHFDHDRPAEDLWFVTDLKKSLWVKKHRVPRELLLPYPEKCIHATTKLLMALDDERIVFSCEADAWTPEGPRWVTRIYDSRTEACTDVSHQLGVRGIVGVYRGSFSVFGE